MVYLSSLLLLASSVIWGLAYIPSRFLGRENFGVFFELLWRFCIPAFILGVGFHKEIGSMSIKMRLRSLAAGAVLFIGLYCAIRGLRTASSPTVGFFLLSLNTILIPLYYLVRTRKAPSITVSAASIGAVFGSLIMSWGDPLAPPNLGTLLCFLSTIAFSAYIIICSEITQDIPLRGLFFYHCVAFIIISLPLFLLFDLKNMQALAPVVWKNPRVWAAILYQGVGSGTTAYLLYFYGLRRTPAAAAAVILAMQSVVGSVAEYFLFGVRLSALTVFGCVIIFASTLFVSLYPEHRAVKESAYE